MKSASGIAATDCAGKLKVLADTTRLAVMEHLMRGPCRVSDMSDNLEVEQSLLSHHLKVLRDAGLVESRRQGKSVVYQVVTSVRVSGRARSIDLGCCKISFDVPKDQ